MTKAELLAVIRLKDSVIGYLNERIDELEKLAITSQAIPLDVNSSQVLAVLSARIRLLEDQLNLHTQDLPE